MYAIAARGISSSEEEGASSLRIGRDADDGCPPSGTVPGRGKDEDKGFRFVSQHVRGRPSSPPSVFLPHYFIIRLSQLNHVAVNRILSSSILTVFNDNLRKGTFV